MAFSKKLALFCLGGGSYVILELLWRGRSHGSMFLAGGSCFLLLGRLTRRDLGLPAKAVLGSGVITAVELLTGLLFNRDHHIWDYRSLPANFQGQICLGYSLLWIPVALGAMGLFRLATRPKRMAARPKRMAARSKRNA